MKLNPTEQKEHTKALRNATKITKLILEVDIDFRGDMFLEITKLLGKICIEKAAETYFEEEVKSWKRRQRAK